MNTVMKNGFLALLLVFATAFSVSAQIKPSKKKPTTTPPPTEQTDKPTESEDTDTKPTTSAKKKTAAKKTDQYFDESGGFKHRLWYGATIPFQFGGTQSYSVFTMGVTPMVGYRIIGGLSAGPRMGITYSALKARTTGQNGVIKSVSLTNYSLGAFTRYKVLKNFFAQAEYEYQSEQYPALTEDANGDIRLVLDSGGSPIKQRFNISNYYAGVGYNSGGLIGYEIMALYNFAVDKNTTALPISYRVGFTYKF
jgi:hypothetical protein